MTAYIGSAGALYAARSNSFIKYGVDVGLSLARIQVADGSEHVSSNLAHAASGMYAWEAAQFILYDCRVLFSLLGRALRLFRPIWPCTGKWFNGQGTGGDQNTVDYLRKSRTGKGRDTTSEIPPVRPATTQVQPAPSLPSSVVVDETSSSSSFERRRRLRETSTKTANVFARLAFLSLRVTTFTALVSLLTILDSPGGFLSSNESKFSSGSSPTPLNVIDVKGMLSCGTWRIVNVVAWAFPLISFALSTSFLFLRIMALWTSSARPSQPDEEAAITNNELGIPTRRLTASGTCGQKRTFPEAARLLPAVLFTLHAAQYVLIGLGAKRLVSLPSEPGTCAYAPTAADSASSLSTRAVIHSSVAAEIDGLAGLRKRAAMPPGLGIGDAFHNSLGNRAFVLGICVYFMALDLFALALLIIGIARSPDFDCPDWKTNFERAASPMGRKHAVGHSPELSRSNTGGDDEGITRRHDVQGIDFSALEISRARMSADAGETAGPSTPRVAELTNARGGIDIRDAHNATPYKCVWTRVLDSGYQQGLHWVIVIAMMKIGMLVCVILNSSPENAAEAMDFQSMCMCIPALVTMSIATNRLFLQITQASRSGDGFMIRQPETMEQLENAGGAAADTFEPERMALPEYVNRAVFVQRIRREEDALDAGAVVRTFGGTMRETPERTQRKNSKATQRLDIPRYKTKEETSGRTNQRGEGSGGY